MNVDVKVPPMGESISSASISAILKANGSYVRDGEEILELETDKVNQVIYAPQSGRLTLQVKVGDEVSVGQVIGFVEPSAQPEASKSIKKGEPSSSKAKEVPPVEPPKAMSKELPSSRKMTAEFVAEIRQPATIAPQPSPMPQAESGATTRKRMSGLRRTIAQRLVEVKNTTAMLTTFNEVDMSVVMEIRSKEKEHFQKRYGVKLGFMSFFVKAVVAALKAFPQINSFIDGDEIVTFNTYDIGVAVSTEKGLFVPVIRDCDQLSFGQIEATLETYAKAVREGAISVDHLRGGSFTITNGGVFGSLLSTPILNPPQSGILGMHAIVKRPIAIEDQVVIRPMMYLALSYDHRIVDGKEAVQFLVHIKQNLEDPARLLLDL